MRVLDLVFSIFDIFAQENDVYKVETVGCTYLAACGVPKPNPLHAANVARLALDLMATLLDPNIGWSHHAHARMFICCFVQPKKSRQLQCSASRYESESTLGP